LLPESGDLRINLQYSSAVDAPTSEAVFNKAARTLIDTCEALTGHISLDIASKLSELEVSGSHRRFLVQRLGSTGSTWVAKLLNSHPDVFCYHEGVIAKIFPSRSYGNAEILTFIDLIAEDRMHDAYAAVGDVGSTWLQHVTAIPTSKFSTGLLLRHPARLLNTRLNVFPSDQSFTSVSEPAQKCIELIWGIKPSDFSQIDQIFLQDAFFFAGQIRALGRVDVVIHIERMNRPDYCHRVLQSLTGQSYERSTITSLINRPINRRTGRGRSITDILDGFSPKQRSWYEQILGDLIGYLGYSLEDDTPMLKRDQPYAGAASASP
jgi:hypothetical protein